MEMEQEDAAAVPADESHLGRISGPLMRIDLHIEVPAAILVTYPAEPRRNSASIKRE